MKKIDEYVILGCSLGAIYIFSEIDWKLINSFEMISNLLDIEIQSHFFFSSHKNGIIRCYKTDELTSASEL